MHNLGALISSDRIKVRPGAYFGNLRLISSA
jgi:hypothetical protein